MGLSWTTPVRGVQLFIAIIVLGLSGYLVSADHGFYDARCGFNVFTALFTILVTIFHLVVALVMSESFLANPIIGVIVDFLCWVFWVAAFGALAAIINAYDDIGDYDVENFFGDAWGGSLKAAVAFGVIEWLLFSATLVWITISLFRGNKGGAGPGHQGV